MKLSDTFYYCDGNLFWKKKPNKNTDLSKPAGGLKNGYLCIRFNGKHERAHRLIWELHNGPIPDDMEIDHIDRDPLNNKIENLRAVTHSQNQWNTKAKGYSWNRKNQKWFAQICASGKRINLGLHDTEDAARIAYLEAKKIYHEIA